MSKTVPNQSIAGKFGFGQPVRRVEDTRFVTGHGCYSDDVALEGALTGYVLRSPYAAGRIVTLNVDDARDAAGVHLVMTGEELQKDNTNHLKCGTLVKQPDGSTMYEPQFPVLAVDRVYHVGQAVAFIVADSLNDAKNAAEMIEFDVEESDAAPDFCTALDAGQPKVHDAVAGNRAFEWRHGDQSASEAAFAKAAHVVELTLINNRIISNPMEPRIAIAEWDEETQKLTMTANTQGGWPLKSRLAKDFLKLPSEQVRVVTPDVGGGFGTRAFPCPEQPMVCLAARALKRPVKWVAERSENMLTDLGGRAHLSTARLALDENHKITGLDIHLRADLGAFLSDAAPFIPTGAMLKVATGVYDVPALNVLVEGVYTNTTPVDAYRGAGRPEAIYLMERLMDKAANSLGQDRVEFRRKNFIPTEAMPYTAASGTTYDDGNFNLVLDDVLTRADWAGFEARRQASAAKGLKRGIGLCYYIESTLGAPNETCAVTFMGDGKLEFTVGTQSNGQGHETAFAQLMADRLGVDIDQVRMIQGDTDRIPTGGGTGGSRSMITQSTAINGVADQIIEKAKALAAEDFECAVEDMRFEAGELSVAGTDRRTSIMGLAEKHPGALDDTATTKIRDNSYPNGCHVAEVEIDPETGQTQVVNYTIVDDFGVLLNPMLVEGQVHGGVVQGLGQALCEQVVFDEGGQLVNGSFMDYAMPRADTMPHMDFHYTEEVPCTTNDMGAKGCGEAGSIASPAAVINAMIDALKADGIAELDMPATPQAVWRALQKAA